MASTKTQLRDLNRYRKVYPYLRRRPRYKWVSDEEVALEVGEVNFSNDTSQTYKLESHFDSAPFVTVTAVDTTEAGTADVNVFITAISTTSITIRTSDNFSGKVHFHAMEIKS